MIRYAAFLTWFLTQLVAPTSAETGSRFQRPARPYDVLHYQLTLRFDAAAGTFRTTTRIRFIALQPLSQLELDAAGLQAGGARLLSGGRTVPVPVSGRPGKPDELQGMLVATLPMRMTPGSEATLELDTAGRVNQAPHGLFALPNPDRKGVPALYMTNLILHGARRLFPCNDDPRDKSSVYIIVETQKGLHIQVIGHFVKTEKIPLNPAQQRTIYNQEKPISTDQIFISIGEMNRHQESDAPGHEPALSVLTASRLHNQPSELEQYQFAETNRALISLQNQVGVPFPFENFTEIDLPVSRLHHEDIIYAAGILVGQLSTSSPLSHLQQVYNVERIAYGVARQWFGGLVSSPSEEQWLSSALARYLTSQYVGQRFGQDARLVLRQTVLERLLGTLDARVQNLRLRSRDATNLDDLIDPAVTLKGAFVIEMMLSALEPSQSRAALQLYLSGHAWASAGIEEFLNAIQRTQETTQTLNPSAFSLIGASSLVEVAPMLGNAGARLTTKPPSADEKLLANTWLDLAGYPILKVRARYDRASRQTLLEIQQRPNRSEEAGPSRKNWYIRLPIGLHRRGSRGFNFYTVATFDSEQITLSVPTPDEPEWIAWNYGGEVLCRIEAPYKSEGEWVLQAHLDPDPASRLDALFHLFHNPSTDQAGLRADVALEPVSAEALKAVVDAVQGDPSPYVRYQLLRQLSQAPVAIPNSLRQGVLTAAHGPTSLDPQDPLAITMVRAGALELAGRIPDEQALALLEDVLFDQSSSVDLLEGAARGLAHRGDSQALRILEEGRGRQQGRGRLYEAIVSSAYGAIDDPRLLERVVRVVRTAAQGGQHELVRATLENLLKNHVLRSGAGFPAAIASLVLGGDLTEDEQVQALMALEGCRRREVRAVLDSVSQRARAFRVRSLAQTVLQHTFG